MKLEIELSPGAYSSLQKVADYCQEDPAHVAAWFVEERVAYLQRCAPSGTIWLGLIKYLREVGGGSKRLDQIEQYIDAASQRLGIPGRTNEEIREEIRLMDPHFKTLENWLMLVGGAD